jgi:hypothetical protein
VRPAHAFGIASSSRADDRLEVADLMRDVGDAVVLEHEPRPQLPLGARHFRLGQPCSRTASDLGVGGFLERDSDTPSIAVSDTL